MKQNDSKSNTQEIDHRESFRDVYESIPVGIIKIDSSFRFLAANPMFSKMVGYSEDELKSMTILALTHPDDRMLSANMAKVALNGTEKIQRHEKRYLHKSGHLVWARVTVHVVNIGPEETFYTLGVIEDISEHMKAQERALESGARYKALYDAINKHSIVAITDREGKITHANENFCKISGYARGELMGQDHRIVNSGVHSKMFFKEIWETIQSGNLWHGEICNKRRDGTLYWVDSTIAPYRGETSENDGYIAIRLDITAQKESELKLREREKLLSTVLDTLPVCVFGKDIQDDFRWTIWNKSAEDLFGLAAKDCLGKTDWDFFPKEQADFFRQKDIETSQAMGVIEIAEEPAQTPRGQVTLHTRKTVILDAEGKPSILLGITEDISDRVRMGKALDAEQVKALANAERFRVLFDSSPVPILVFSEVGILDANMAAARILGAEDKKSLLGQHPAVFSPEFQPDGSTSAEKSMEMDRLAKVSGIHRFEWTHQKLNGMEFPVEVTLTPILWNDESALLVLWNDLTEKKKQELQMVQMSKLASLGEMSAGIAHEINNPLAIIASSAGLLSKFANHPEKLEAKLQSIHKSVDRISRIVKGLKKFSRSGGKSDLSTHSLCKVAKEAVDLTDALAKEHSTLVAVDCQSHALVQCDEVEIEQVLINLIHNAIDAVKVRSEKWVRISVTEEGDTVVLSVMDSGPVIPAPVREKLFDPFFTTKKVGEGTGLGLSITKGIIDEHGATITVRPDLSNTCFEIRFPKAKVGSHAA